MRRWTALHRVFAKLGPRLGDFTTTPRILPLLTRSPLRVMCVWCVETGAEWGAALDCLALRIREIGPSTRLYHGDSKIPSFGALALESGVRLVRGDPSRAGCGDGLPRIAHSRNFPLDSAIFVPARRLFPVLTRSPSKAARVWRVETGADWDAAMDCLALRIREIGPSTWQYHDDASKIPSFDTLALESDVRLVRGDRG
jgi:hypothetical protein